MNNKIIIISEDDNLDNTVLSINNLKQNGCLNEEYIVATKKENNSEVKKFCKENNVELYEYASLQDVYYELPKNLEFDYISFINDGDTYSPKFKEILSKHIENSMENIYILPIIYNEKKYILNKSISKIKQVDIEKLPNKIWIHINSVFISKNIFNRIEKPEVNDLKYYIDNNLLLMLVNINGWYENINSIRLNTLHKLEDSPESKLENYDILWYKNIFNNIDDLSKFSNKQYKAVLPFLQYA